MNKEFFAEMRKISHEDEMRSKLLLHGVKRILEEKQEKRKRGLLGLLRRKTNHL
ncbi:MULTISPECIES: hypothetical protein [Paenibacillus]|uniref:Uncharacterized protein n=1 Tax=Paenibacillus glycanilyticus TaxID=126569 RepID=A0ABQ6NIG8_9BACL|nr:MULTISPECIES: hypothetical protein [Paenibacillus]MCK9862287.1 hypothetical protein [Paenibacillus sp. ATY16]GMK44891.1 hypothetical protein PghCCS26_20190 [Paenibacillus glycanilyticus]